MEPIEQEFASRGVLRGGLILLRAQDALSMVRRCRGEGIEVLGLDGFRLTEQTTQPLMEQSIDLTKSGNGDSWARAESFLVARLDQDLYFEVVIDT
jgi:hypothetical protein